MRPLRLRVLRAPVSEPGFDRSNGVVERRRAVVVERAA
jgi:hypothetical protein